MKKLLTLALLAAMLGTGCSSSEFKVVLTMANSGADYIAVVSGHASSVAEIDAAFALAGSEYNSLRGRDFHVDQGARRTLNPENQPG